MNIKPGEEIPIIADVGQIQPNLLVQIYRYSQPRKEWGSGGPPLPYTAAIYVDPTSLDGHILAVARIEQGQLTIELPRESADKEVTNEEIEKFAGTLGMNLDPEKIVDVEVGKASRHDISRVFYIQPKEPVVINQPRPNPCTQGLFILIPVAHWEELPKTSLVDRGSVDAERSARMLAAIYGKSTN